MTKSRQHRRGFSLLEAILTTFLIGLFLGVLGNLTATLRTVTRVSDQRANSGEMRTLLGVIRGELTEAVKVTHPSKGNKAAQIQLLRLKPETLTPSAATTARLSLPPATNVSYYWDPIDPTFLEPILYDVNNKSLRRKLGSAPASQIGSIESLQASQPQAGLFVVVIEIRTPKGPEFLKCVVDRP